MLGGAARAAYRIHRALCQAGVQSRMRVAVRMSDDANVYGPGNRLQKALVRARPSIAALLSRMCRAEARTTLSPAILPGGLVRELNTGEHDIIHLHWIGGEFLSIEEIGKLAKPVVWTLHDMWPFCGAEHYAPDGADARFKVGYQASNRPKTERGPDLNRWCWNRKLKAWRRPIEIICDSNWLARCARESALMKSWHVDTIHYPLDIDTWRPIGKRQAREILKLPERDKVVLFGALGGDADHRKGADLLREALLNLARQGIAETTVAVFGQSEHRTGLSYPLPVRYFGHLHDDISLALLYSAADVMVVPSRQEAFGQTALEAHACGTPVVAFDVGGLPDIVDHLRTGYLARPFDVGDLASGIRWILADRERSEHLGVAAREKVTSCFSNQVIAAKYQAVYARLLGNSC
jgi:glycosyltransferase involved in cell wall biosynthesis